MECKKCGVCCQLFMINLDEEEYASQKFKTQFDEFVPDFLEAELIGANILEQKADGSCIYLKEGSCSIHDDRPMSCRKFFCDSDDDDHKEMIMMIKEKKGVSKL